MAIKVSLKNQTFYDDRIPYDSLPDDLVEIDDEKHLELIRAMNEDGRRLMKVGKSVGLSDLPPSRFHEWDIGKQKWTISEDGKKRMTQETADKNKQTVTEKLDEAVTYINRKQWSGKASLGRLDANEQKLYGSWLDYIDALSQVDISADSDMKLPVPPEY